MTRINTNVSSLNAQNSLAKSNLQLQQALTRLSTGLRINVGKDDPAGLIASELLRSDIVGTTKAISNSQSANQMIATADSALGQVSALLDDIRGLVEEAANKGALSDAQIAANQLQIDSSLQAIDRVSQTTQFQGKSLLDGNLDFISQSVDATKMSNLQVNQANFGTMTQIDVGVNVATQATQAAMTYTGSALSGAATVEIGGSTGFQTFSFGAGSTIQQVASAINLVSDATGVEASLNNRVAATATYGQSKLVNTGGVEGVKVEALTAGKTPGDFTIRYTKAAATSATWTASSPNIIDVNVATSQWAAAGAAAVPVDVGEGANTLTLAAKIAGTQFNGVDLTLVDGVANTATYDYTTNRVTVTTTMGTMASAAAAPVSVGAGTNTMTFAAKVSGTAYNGADLEIIDGGVGAESATYNYTTNRVVATLTTAHIGAWKASNLKSYLKTTGINNLFTIVAADDAGANFISTGVKANLSQADAVDGAKASDVAALITAQLGDLFTAAAVDDTTDTHAYFTTAGTYNNLSNALGTDGGVVTDHLEDVRAAIDAIGGGLLVNATNLGSNSATTVADIVNYSAAIGDLNDAAGASEPNNRIQLTGTDPAAHKDVIFRTNGASQDLSISFVNNTRTNGKSTVYLQGGGVAPNSSVLKVEAVAQGSTNDGWTFNIVHSATEKSILWDKANKTVTYTNVLTGGGAKTGTEIATELTAIVGTQFQVTAVAGGANAFTTGTSGVTADGSIYDGVYVNLKTDANGVATSTAAEVVNAINANTAMQSLGIVASNMTFSDGSGVAATGTATLMEMGKTASNAAATGTTFAATGSTGRVTVTAKTAGAAYSNVQVAFANDGVSGSEYAAYDATNKILTFHVVSGTTTSDNLATRFLTGSGTAQSVKDLFTVTGSGAGAVTSTDVGKLTGGVTYTGTSLGGVDSEGNYDAGQVIGTAGLSIKSTEYGSKQFVSVKALSGTFTTYDTTNTASTRTTGTDASVRINGIQAVSDGLNVSLSTSTLDLGFDLISGVAAGSSFSFSLTGGGALFQIGPDVVSNQQARMGIGSVNSSRLSGTAGRLDELKSGGSKSLTGDVTGAGKVVNQAITTVATLRGRLGAFQKTTLDTNIATLTDTLQNLTDAESSIRDADFAKETANLTRAQILSQSGLTVLKLANQSPQQVLSLLQ